MKLIMRNNRISQVRVIVRSALTVFIFGLVAVFSGDTYGSSPIPIDPTTPDSLKDDPNPIIEDIIVRQPLLGLSTVIVTFADENAAEELQQYFYFMLFRGEGIDNYLAAGGLRVFDEPSLSENRVLRFLLKREYVDYSSIAYTNPAERRLMIFRLSDWVDREGDADHSDDDQDKKSDEDGWIPPY